MFLPSKVKNLLMRNITYLPGYQFNVILESKKCFPIGMVYVSLYITYLKSLAQTSKSGVRNKVFPTIILISLVVVILINLVKFYFQFLNPKIVIWDHSKVNRYGPGMCIRPILWFPHIREEISTTSEKGWHVDGNQIEFLYLFPILPLFYLERYISSLLCNENWGMLITSPFPFK